jgi:aminoglycoside phosphotransferase (APT) family kinase protein
MSDSPPLDERQRAMTSPDELVADVVETACGSPLLSKTRIREGFSNEVYAATAVDGQQVIVRIHWYESPHFEGERWALDQCARLGLPAPRLMLLQHRDDGDMRRSVCVESRLPGTTLRAALNARTLRPGELHAVLVATGAFLATLHTVATTGFGRIDATGRASAPTWEAYRHRNVLSHTYQAARNLGIATAEVDDAMLLLEGPRDFWRDASHRLLHGDVTPQNIMVEAGQFRGLIDFEFPSSGDPAADLATWDYYQHSPFHNPTAAELPTEWLLEGYQGQTPLDPSFIPRLVGCRLQFGLDLLNYHGIRDDQDPRFLALIRTSFERDLGEMRQVDRA